jgi:hypothetical protein
MRCCVLQQPRPLVECKRGHLLLLLQKRGVFPGQVEQQGRVTEQVNAPAGKGNYNRILAFAHERRRPIYSVVDQPFQHSGPLVPINWTTQSIFAE